MIGTDESGHETEKCNQKLMMRGIGLLELMSWVNKWNHKLSLGVGARKRLRSCVNECSQKLSQGVESMR